MTVAVPHGNSEGRRKSKQTGSVITVIEGTNKSLQGFEMKEYKNEAIDIRQSTNAESSEEFDGENINSNGYSVKAAVFNIICCQVGVGMLALPPATAKGGWLGTALCLLFAGLINTFGMLMLSKCLERLRPTAKVASDLTFPGIGFAAAGRCGYVVAATSQYGMGIAAALVFIVISNSMSQLIITDLNSIVSPGLVCLIFVALQFFVTPLKTMNHVAPVALFGALTSILVLVLVGVQNVVELKDKNIPEKFKDEKFNTQIIGDFNQLLETFIIFIFSFGAAIVFPEVSSAMKRPSQDSKAITWANTICCSMYAIIAFLTYGIYRGGVKYTYRDDFSGVDLSKENKASLVTDLYTRGSIVPRLIGGVMFAHLVTAFPILINPTFRVIEEKLKIDYWKAPTSSRIAFRCIFIMVLYLIAVIFVKHLISLMAILSGTLMTLASFICPCWFFISLFWREYWYHGGLYGRALIILNVFTIVISVGFGFASTYDRTCDIIEEISDGAWVPIVDAFKLEEIK